MFKRWQEFLAKHQAAPEDSITYRVAVTVLVMFCLILTLHQMEWPTYWPAILLLTPAASVLSYYRRASSNMWLKIYLSFAMMALLLWFLRRLSQSLYDPRIPLAELLIWLQTLHAFDLPARKDLRYTGLVALILVAIACVLTYSSAFAVFLLLFCALFLAVLAVDFWAGNRTRQIHLHQPDGSAGQGADNRSLNARWLARSVTRGLPLSILGAALIFLFMPRYQGLTLRSLPVNWNIQFSLAKVSEGEILNKSSGRNNIDTNGKPRQVSGDDYFGFDSVVNLNSRGKLSNKLVMKVRTSNWQYHRGVTFGEYTGFGWKSLPWEPEKKTVDSPPFGFPSVNWQDERVTIYYIDTNLPNIIFTPPAPSRLYFPSSELYVQGSFDPAVTPRKVVNFPTTLISPFFLEEGLVYSTLNQSPATTVKMLKERVSPPNPNLGKQYPWLQPYLQLPDTVTQRTRNLAAQLTEGKRSPWARAAALTSYLQNNYSYRLDVPFYPETADTADYFLFETREGYCEQFATALCVMARSVNLPARYVTGFLPGTFNPISGFYEVKASDAHAWVEIYFEGYGWMIFDPVPGGNANPEVNHSSSERFLFESLLEYFQVPPALRETVPMAIRGLIALAVLSFLVALVRGRAQPEIVKESSLAPYLRKAEALTQARSPGETVRDWSRRLGQWPQLGVLAEIYEERFYRDLPLRDEDYERLEQALAELKEKAKDPDTES